MMKDQQIICVAFPKWEGDYMKSSVQLMTELAKHNELLYVDYPFTFKDLAMGLADRADVPVDRLLGRQPQLRSQALSGGGQVHLLTLPPFLPGNWAQSAAVYDRLLAWNGRQARRRIKKAMQQLGFKQPIVINAFNPALGNALAGQLGEALLVYYCYDEISAAPWISKHGARHERSFMQRADLTICSSAQLLADKSPLAKRSALVKNGVQLDLFENPGPRPAELPNEGRPIIGYLGSVDERLDYKLLGFLAAQWPDSHLVFVGRIVATAAAKRLQRLPNVSFLGAKQPEELGSYADAFDAALIPFVRNKLTAGIYPLKINEYLAAGKPVIATPFSDLSDFEGLIEIAGTPEAFAQAVRRSVAEDSPQQAAARRAFAQGHSWTARTVAFGQAIEQALTLQKM